jgi:polysaccharide export outer membrane protein
MNKPDPQHFRILFPLLVLSLVTAMFASAQTTQNGRNNPYSPSPVGGPMQNEQPVAPVPAKTGPTDITFVMQSPNSSFVDDSRVDPVRMTIAQRTYKIAKDAEARSRPATETYKIGVGDVLFVNLKNSAQGSGYYTVRPNGTIDYPLAGENVIVADQTAEALEDILASAIKLFPDPQIEVKVRQYSSHKITVSGLVSNAGVKNLQREAIPLYVIRAEAVADAKASRVTITRSPLQNVETYELRDPATDNVLILPGNTVEFTAPAAGYYFISGDVVSGGQKNIDSGMTLYQALAAAGGTKGDPKKAVLRRKNQNGMLAATEYNLRAIREGKSPDPGILAGDVIEIRN